MKPFRLTDWMPLVFAAVLSLAASSALGAQQAPQTGSGGGPPVKKASELGRARGGLYAASDGGGRIRLFWLPAGGKWPAGGWRLEESGSGRGLVDRVGPGSDSALAAPLSARELEGFRKLSQLFASPGQDEKKKAAHAVAVMRAMTDWTYAQAVGLGRILSGVPAGPRTYRVVALDAAGSPTAMAFTSRPVDSAIPSLLPTPPTAVRAESTLGGVALFWEPPAGPRSAVGAYHVEREAGGATALVTERPIGLLRGRTAQTPALMDANAPLEQELLYRVYGVDIFGRKSSPATARLFADDLNALVPPQVAAKAGQGRNALAWKPNPSPHTAGYLVERSMLYAGPYETLTPQVLAARDTQYEDKTVVGGTAYYYRVRSVGPRGDVGTPSAPVMAKPTNRDRPSRPEGLKADVGRTRIRLTWQPVRFPIAGYMIERKADSASRWIQLNERLTPEPLYDDHFPLYSEGAFAYRVIAFAFDNQQSDPSSSVQVTLLDTRPPTPPVITGINGSDGKVRLTFKPMPPEDDAYQFYVVRSVSDSDPGLVVGDALSARARSFEDAFVKAGQRYWYRLVAVDKNGNRSDLGEARSIAVMYSAIPTPGKPQARFAADPIPHVIVAFGKAPTGLGVLIQRKTAGDEWRTILGPIVEETQAMDTRPPVRGAVAYRLLYQADNNVVGQPSDPVEITR